MIIEYINELISENNDELLKYEHQMSALFADLESSNRILEVLQKEKDADKNIFSPRTIDMNIRNKIDDEKRNIDKIEQDIEYTRSFIETHSKKKEEFDNLLIELNKLYSSHHPETESQHSELQNTDHQQSEQQPADTEQSNINPTAADSQQSSINPTDLPDSDEQLSEADDANLQEEVTETPDEENAGDKENTGDKENAEDKENVDDKENEQPDDQNGTKQQSVDQNETKQQPDDQNETKQQPDGHNETKQDEELKKKEYENAKISAEFLSDLYRSTEICLAMLNGNRNKCRKELLNLKNMIKNEAARLKLKSNV